MSQAMDFRTQAPPFEHWSDDSYNYPDRCSSVSFLESKGYTAGSIAKISLAWFFFAIMAFMWAIVPVFSLLVFPAILGCMGILTEAYASAEERRLQTEIKPGSAKRRARRM